MARKTRKKHLRVVPPGPPENVLIVECTFRDVEGPLTIPVEPKEWDRIHLVLDDDRKAFLGLEGLDGREVFLNLAHLHTCRVFKGKHRPTRPKGGTLICPLLGGETLELSDVDCEWIPNIVMSLEEFGNLDERFVYIPQEIGEVIWVNMADILYLEYPSIWHPELEEFDDEGEN